jgi:hypothetical protein
MSTAPLLQTGDAAGRSDPTGNAAPTRGRYLHHPHVVVRVACLPVATVKRLYDGASRRSLDALEAAGAAMPGLVAEACQHLEHAIGLDEFDQSSRRRLLEIKRKLFNGKVPRLDADAGTLDLLAPAAAAAVRAAAEALMGAATLDASLAETYEQENAATRRTLRHLCTEDENFLRALAYSAPVLTEGLIEAAENPQKYTGKRGRNLDTGLYNYFLRATTKVSPLTYFTPVMVGEWSEEAEGGLELDGRDVRSRVEVSRSALSRVPEALSRNLKFWGDSHPLELNPTIIFVDGYVVYNEIWGRGKGSPRVWGVRPPGSRLPMHPRLQALHDFYRAAGPESAFTLRELFQGLGTTLFPDQPAAFGGYIAQAVRAGLLVPRMDIYEQEDLVAYLDQLFEARAPEAAKALRKLQNEVELYQGASHRERLSKFTAIREAFIDLCGKVGADPTIESKAPLIYEDCFLTGGSPAIPLNFVGSAVADVQGLSRLFPLLDYNHVVQSITAALFRRRYGDDAVLPATECLESLAGEAQNFAMEVTPLLLGEKERALEAVSESAGLLSRQKDVLLGKIMERMSTGEDVVLDDAFIEEAVNGLPAAVRARAMSYTVIGQGTDEADGGLFVLNRLYSGHSMLMSRFMRGQDEASVSKVSSYLSALAGPNQPVEIPGVFGFNANIHPQFVDAELCMTGRRPNYRNTRKIPVDDLHVRYDPEFDRLAFSTAAGEDLAVHYLGFLNLMMLPNIYQVLGRMSQQGLIIDLWQDLFWTGLLAGEGPTRLSRVSYRNVVLSRRSLFVPAASVPSADCSEVDFFKSIHAMLRDWGEGGDCFARLVPSHEDFAGDPDERAVVSDTTIYKPALLSLDSPLSVASLQRRLQRRPAPLLFQEALPAVGSAGVPWNGERHACEVQFEIARTAGR